MKERIKCKISYDGTNFSGYQIQPNGRTVQEDFEKSLAKVHKGKTIRVTASGRTDAGVHAKGQVIHFDTPLTIPAENWTRALNAVLPEDIRVQHSEIVSNDFHARFDVIEKEYRYFILNTQEQDVFARNYTFHVSQNLDIDAMNEASKLLEGQHNFTSFCATKSGVKGDKIRDIYKATWVRDGDNIVFSIKGNGFLYNMVRILVGTLVEIGKKQKEPYDIIKIIDAKDRAAAGKTAPPQGLFLWNVTYRNRDE